jgi:hypothetical protein
MNKKSMINILVTLGILGFIGGGIGLGPKVDAATYYGNGVYCNKKKCWVDWGKAVKIIGNNAAANLFTRGNAGWNNK